MTSSRDRLEAALARIADPAGEGARACLTVYTQAARDAADAADARAKAGISLGPLDGAIVSIKDLFDVAGEVTRAGSKVLAEEGKPAAADAPAVQRLARRRRGDRRQDQHVRVRFFRRRHQSALRHAGQSGRSQAHARRLHLRRRGGGGRRHVRDRHRQRHRRLDPHSRRRSVAWSASSRAASESRRPARFRCRKAWTSIGPIARSVADCAQDRRGDGRRGFKPSIPRRTRICASALRRACHWKIWMRRSASGFRRPSTGWGRPAAGFPTRNWRCSTA